jgi:hypothetical protein
MDTSFSTSVNYNAPLGAGAADSIASVQPVSQQQYASYGQGNNPPAVQPLIYTTGSDGQQRVFNNRSDADNFTRQDYKNSHPDAPEQGRTENGWDAFKRGFSDTVSNPLGQTASQIAKAAGASPQTQQELYKAGGNPLGYVAKEAGAAAGASPETQDKLEKGGAIAESLAPVWGQARHAGQMMGNAVQGKAPSVEDAQSAAQDAKGLGALQPSASTAGAGAKPAAAAQESAAKPTLNPPQRLDDGRIGYPLSPTQPPRLPAENTTPSAQAANAGAAATSSGMANRDALSQRVSQSPHAETPGSYPNTVGIVNDALKQGGVGLSDNSLANIQKNMDGVDSGSLTHAQGSQRESKTFANDAMNSQLSLKDRFTAAAGSVLNGTVGPAFMAEKDVGEHVAGGSRANTEKKAVMSGFMTNDPLYN